MQSPFVRLGTALIDTEMPIHVGSLSFLAVFVGGEPSPTLRTLETLGFKEKRKQLRAESTRLSVLIFIVLYS